MSNRTLLFRTIRRDCLQMMVLALFAFFLTFLCLQILRGIDQVTYVTRVFSSSKLIDKVFYSFTPWSNEYPKEIMDSEVNAIESISHVENAQVVEICTLANDIINAKMTFYNHSGLDGLNFSLAEGTYPESSESNQVILPNKYRSFYKVNDTVDLEFLTNDTMFADNVTTVSVRISGFFKDDVLMSFGAFGANIGLNNFFREQNDAGVVYRLTDANGNQLEGDYTNYVIITPIAGTDIDLLDKEISEVVRSKSYVHTGSELVSRYWESNNEVLQSLFILSFSLFSLSFAVLFAGTYMSLVNKQKEMAVWYISGVAWKDCILIAITPKMLSILCGYWFALFYYVRQTGQEIDYGITAHFRWVYIPISLSIIGLIFLSGVYPFYSISVKKSPIELFRKD